MRTILVAAAGAALLLGTALAQAVEKAPPAEAPQEKQQAQEGEPEQEKVELEGKQYYDSTGLRDPFRPFTLDLRVSTEATQPLTPLQKYELGQLTLAAVVVGMQPPRAMVEDNSGMGYIVTVGTPIGRNGGVVKGISESGVVVEEKTRDFFGREQLREVTMTIPSEDGGDQLGKETRERP